MKLIEDEKQWNLYFFKSKVLIVTLLSEKDDENINFLRYKNFRKNLKCIYYDAEECALDCENIIPLMISNTIGGQVGKENFFHQIKDEELSLKTQHKHEKLIELIFTRNELTKNQQWN